MVACRRIRPDGLLLQIKEDFSPQKIILTGYYFEIKYLKRLKCEETSTVSNYF
jgi:hypothetical protein